MKRKPQIHERGKRTVKIPCILNLLQKQGISYITN